jgi:hypothetical protein
MVAAAAKYTVFPVQYHLHPTHNVADDQGNISDVGDQPGF